MTDEADTGYCVHGQPWDDRDPCDEAPESSPDRVRPSGVGSTHHDFGDYDLGGGRMVSDRYRDDESAVYARFTHTPDEPAPVTKRTFTVVRVWHVEADTVLQALDAAPRDVEPDEVHVHAGVLELNWLRGDRG